MNLQLGNQSVVELFGVLGEGYPEIIGTLDEGAPLLSGSLMETTIHDLIIIDGNVPLYSGLDQRIDCTLRTFRGEWWLDPTIGVPYFEEILKKNPDMSVVRQAFASVILSVPGVQEVTRLEVKFLRPTRALRVDFEVKGTDTIPVSGTSEVPV